MKKKILEIFICIILLFTVFNNIIYGQNIVKNRSNSFQSPFVEITNPDDGAVVTDPDIIVEGNAFGELPLIEYGYIISYPGGGMFSEFWDINPPVEYYEFSIDVFLVEGSDGNLITVYAKDSENNRGEDSITVFYEPGGEDKEPPIVKVESPQDGTVYPYPQEVSLYGSIYDNIGVDSIGYKYNWPDGSFDSGYIEIQGGPVQNYEFFFAIDLYSGLNEITVYAIDESENNGEDSVYVNVEDPCSHTGPTMTDNSGETTFHGIFIGCDHRGKDYEVHGPENDAPNMEATLLEKPGWDDENTTLLLGDEATVDNIHEAINDTKDKARPGDEFLFYFSSHATDFTYADNDDNESDGYDEDLEAWDGNITDDTLARWISGFPDCVTITVKLDCCNAGGFEDGDRDVQNATNAEGERYGPDHINIEPAVQAGHAADGAPYLWNDTDHDGIADPDELTGPLRMRPFQDGYIWDRNSNWRYDPGYDEIYNEEDVYWLGDFTLANLRGLANEGDYKNYSTTNADRNKDGITTTKELFEYSINIIHEWFDGDNDNDGLVDEDGYDYEIINGRKKRIYIDNDNDGWCDEDIAPYSSAFWYNNNPNKPNKISGVTSGKKGETYTYSTYSSDADGDDVFYWFDWGDGTNSGWIGPYISGDACDASHSWNKEGNYIIKVKVRDRCFTESDWTSLKISMPKNKNKFLNMPLFNFLIYLLNYYLSFHKIIQ